LVASGDRFFIGHVVDGRFYKKNINQLKPNNKKYRLALNRCVGGQAQRKQWCESPEQLIALTRLSVSQVQDSHSIPSHKPA